MAQAGSGKPSGPPLARERSPFLPPPPPPSHPRVWRLIAIGCAALLLALAASAGTCVYKGSESLSRVFSEVSSEGYEIIDSQMTPDTCPAYRKRFQRDYNLIMSAEIRRLGIFKWSSTYENVLNKLKSVSADGMITQEENIAWCDKAEMALEDAGYPGDLSTPDDIESICADFSRRKLNDYYYDDNNDSQNYTSERYEDEGNGYWDNDSNYSNEDNNYYDQYYYDDGHPYYENNDSQDYGGGSRRHYPPPPRHK